ncbi:hypothetical protein BGX23_011149 [Mortierella sp. AD031]|nr:hypothetical protein BGX23_011149 [Mortierella sp. AD031]
MDPQLPPELVEIVALHLSQNDLAQLVRVNKEWHTMWTPHLWRSMLMTCSRNEIAMMSPEGQVALRRNGHHIRIFIGETFDSHAFHLLRPAQGLYLTTLFIGSVVHDGSTTRDSLVALLRRCSTLRTLTIDSVRGGEEEFIAEIFKTIAGSLDRLQKLALFMSGIVRATPGAVQEFLETCPSSLEYLAMRAKFCRPPASGSTDVGLKSVVIENSKPHPKLKCFSFETDTHFAKDRSIIPRVLTTFLRGCTCLESVNDFVRSPFCGKSWMFDYPVVLEAVRDALGYTPLKYVESPLTLALPEDDVLAQMLVSVVDGAQQGAVGRKGWHTLHLRMESEDMPATYRALLERSHLGSLGYLTVDDGTPMTSQEYLSILCHGNRLQVLQLEPIPTVLVSDLGKSPPWKCTWLVLLHLQIAGIPRPDVQIDYRGRPIHAASPLHNGTMEESRAIQRQVYSRLAMLTCLRSLTLGVDARFEEVEVHNVERGLIFYDPLLQPTSLEMTLDSGLGLLAGLKDLRSLDVSNMEHRIGERELRFMEREWPRMASIMGLVKRKRCPVTLPDGKFEMATFGRPYGSTPETLRCDVRFQY